jgi:Xaa-Pro aminopeptidase
VPAAGLVEGLRAVKDEGELAAIRAAASLADGAYEQLRDTGLAGRTEREVARSIVRYLEGRGADEVSFPPIVAAGAHGALPHASPRDVEIPSGVLVVVDLGARLDGYCSDCTRTFAAGEVDEEAEAVYELVLEAQLAGLEATRAGVSGRDADSAARAIIDDGGHGERFGHGLGHGVGLLVHEDPRLAKTSEATLAAGHVVTVEPGVYLPGRFGVRIEDLVAVTGDGREVLSSYPKELTSVE